MTTSLIGDRASGTTRSAEGQDGSGAMIAASYLADVPEPVRDHLSASVLLRDFLHAAGTLTLKERRLLVDQALVLLEQNYVHLPLKVAIHAVNPVQRLRLLRIRLERQTPATMEPEWMFHAEMSEIFHSVRDLHTNYLLPAPFAGKIAYLPFLVEEYVDDSERRYLVSHLLEGFPAPEGFAPGAEVTHWNGIPIARAVDLNAARFAGSNLAARRSRGLQSLTIRPLSIHLPPNEEWVTISYVGTDGEGRELREQWLVTENLPPAVGDVDEVTSTALALGLDLDADETGRAKTLLFAPGVVARQQADTGVALTAGEVTAGADVPTTMSAVFRARTVETPSGTFGHIRIFTFSVDDPLAFVEEFVRLIGRLPQSGLIVDVRGNGGGHIFASEFALQTLTPHRIVPEPVQFISSALNLRICAKHKDNPTGQIDLSSWFPSLDQATEIGATFSSGFPITPEDGANAIGQQYQGPVVLITDARCYSATDIFAAGFKDHAIGIVLGVDDNTGAGGANVWTHGLLKNLLELPSPDADSPYTTLPKGANMRVSIRRTLRVGSSAGTPVEDLGVVPDERHHLTRRDVLQGNVDLLNHAGELLAGIPVRALTVTATANPDGSLTLDLEVANVDRADVYIDGRPRASADVASGSATIVVPDAAGAEVVKVEAFDQGELVAARTLTV